MGTNDWPKVSAIISGIAIIVYVIFEIYGIQSSKITPTPSPTPTLPILPTLTPEPTLIEGLIDFTTTNPYFIRTFQFLIVLLFIYSVFSSVQRK